MRRDTTITCSFASPAPVRKDGYPLKSVLAHEQVLLVLSAGRSALFSPSGRPEASYRIINASDAFPLQSPYHVLSSDRDFHRASTRFFVAPSIKISSGHGRVKPSDAHLRVASIPIFDPKSCILAA